MIMSYHSAILMSQPLLNALKLFGDAAKMMIIAIVFILISFSMVLALPFTARGAFQGFTILKSLS